MTSVMGPDMTLLKFDSGWRVMAKVYNSHDDWPLLGIGTPQQSWARVESRCQRRLRASSALRDLEIARKFL